MNRVAVVSLLALVPAMAQADSVFLKSGGELKGQIVERRPDAVVIEVGPGRVTVPMRTVARITPNVTELDQYQGQAAALSPRDVAAWLDLAAWAQAHDLGTQAREAYEHVVAVEPGNVAAHLGLGDVRVGARWMNLASANRARGLVEFEGDWVTPRERQMRIEARAAESQDRHVAREADARAREAEARAREAEARANAAESNARQAPPADGGIPYPYVFGPSYGSDYDDPYGYGGRYGGRRRSHVLVVPAPAPPTASRPPRAATPPSPVPRPTSRGEKN